MAVGGIVEDGDEAEELVDGGVDVLMVEPETVLVVLSELEGEKIEELDIVLGEVVGLVETEVEDAEEIIELTLGSTTELLPLGSPSPKAYSPNLLPPPQYSVAFPLQTTPHSPSGFNVLELASVLPQ